MSDSSEENKKHNIVNKIIRDPYALNGGDLHKYMNVNEVLKIVFIIVLCLYLAKNYYVWFADDAKAASMKPYYDILHDATRVVTTTAATTGLFTMFYHLKK